MRYVKISELDPTRVRQGLNAALKEQNIEVDDLLRRLGYLHLKEGRRDFAHLLEHGTDLVLLRRITERLGLDHEALSGERLPDFEIVPVTVGTNLRVNRSAFAGRGGVIPRLKCRATGEIYTTLPERSGARADSKETPAAGSKEEDL